MSSIKRILKLIIINPASILFYLGNGSFLKAKNVVQYYYIGLAFLAVSAIPFLLLGDLPPNDFSPIFVISWAHFFEYSAIVPSILFLFVISSLVAALFYRNRVARFMAFIGVLEFHAFISSFGQMDHLWYLWVYISFLFVFLPDVWDDKKHSLLERKKFLLLFWSAQAFVLLTYSLSGIWKVYEMISQILANQVHALMFESVALHIASWLPRLQSPSLLGAFFIEHPWVGWPFFIVIIYLQFFAFFVAFRPSLHRIWSVGLILFQVATFLTMNIIFLPSVLFLLLLFFNSPFRRKNTTWQDMLSDLPLFGWMFKLYLAKQREKFL